LPAVRVSAQQTNHLPFAVHFGENPGALTRQIAYLNGAQYRFGYAQHLGQLPAQLWREVAGQFLGQPRPVGRRGCWLCGPIARGRNGAGSPVYVPLTIAFAGAKVLEPFDRPIAAAAQDSSVIAKAALVITLTHRARIGCGD